MASIKKAAEVELEKIFSDLTITLAELELQGIRSHPVTELVEIVLESYLPGLTVMLHRQTFAFETTRPTRDTATKGPLQTTADGLLPTDSNGPFSIDENGTVSQEPQDDRGYAAFNHASFAFDTRMISFNLPFTGYDWLLEELAEKLKEKGIRAIIQTGACFDHLFVPLGCEDSTKYSLDALIEEARGVLWAALDRARQAKTRAENEAKNEAKNKARAAKAGLAEEDRARAATEAESRAASETESRTAGEARARAVEEDNIRAAEETHARSVEDIRARAAAEAQARTAEEGNIRAAQEASIRVAQEAQARVVEETRIRTAQEAIIGAAEEGQTRVAVEATNAGRAASGPGIMTITNDEWARAEPAAMAAEVGRGGSIHRGDRGGQGGGGHPVGDSLGHGSLRNHCGHPRDSFWDRGGRGRPY